MNFFRKKFEINQGDRNGVFNENVHVPFECHVQVNSIFIGGLQVKLVQVYCIYFNFVLQRWLSIYEIQRTSNHQPKYRTKIRKNLQKMDVKRRNVKNSRKSVRLVTLDSSLKPQNVNNCSVQSRQSKSAVWLLGFLAGQIN